ncbi:nicotinate phosphoribosyltransferase [Lacticaseibacillus zeae]|uniref:Nicotinate phosphoribosyltransferase n=1 Tax=Lacticaseibacillus zeae subsp. silagei TaxID=3068307 RepID=A0ABD7Z9Q0_LACZE|nr:MULTISPECIES: nicotinate phosphoribosyltransferase [Lacticaseibacillus]MDE3316655.1 nicotinate phosphoribosyltransferase [Lacticaseibacillus zeae]OFR97190.1 nicotinate phosphoribosyltransferase [Lactobacillus sp. HMSC068F07]WLV83447.1 nicotinate phosphoribosyltransferase [Lacticaseibacillus sp. NCIMB 15475]WLV86196.1 nicotinate phosphoribosyltransferase [Lacticaseibacillus sp. NCIMB 15474]
MNMNPAMLTDLYEFSMANGYCAALPHEDQAVFDLFFRTVPDHGSFVIAAGLQQVVEALRNFHFEDADISYLRSLKLYSETFLDYLKKMRLDCTVLALPEGTPVFPREPLLTVQGPLMQVQLLETLLLNIVNHQSLIATKARRITAAAEGRPVMEFGARRAQGPDASVYGARAAVIGGCSSTSNVLSAQQFNIPAAGTMAHSWVEAFPDELSAFRAWAKVYPDNSALLVDTYDVLKSGVPNAITVFKELKAAGHHPVGIRIDSGDITQLAKQARQMLDAAGFPDAKITASNALDETVVQSLLKESAPIDNFGIGENLITSASSPVLSGVYKMAALQANGQWLPKIKVSASREKTTLPSHKQVYRLYHHNSKQAFADVIALADETLPQTIAAVSANPLATHPQVTLSDFFARPLLKPAFNPGKELSVTTDVFAIQKYARQELAQLPEATQRLVNPDLYPVYLTPKLATLQQQLIDEHHQNSQK